MRITSSHYLPGPRAGRRSSQEDPFAGPAPVDLTEYNRAVTAQGIGARLTAGHLRFALNDLVVPERVFETWEPLS